MKTCRLIVVLLATILALLTACNPNDGKKAMASSREQTITYGAGRFIIDIPISMQYRGGSFHARFCTLEEVAWSDADSIRQAKAIWRKRLEEIRQINPPKGKENVIIEIVDVKSIGKWCKGVFYYKEPKDPQRAYIDLLLDSGPTGLWIKFSANADEKDKIIGFLSKIAKAYRPPGQRLAKAAVLKNVDSFYLEHGAIDLPFKFKESVAIGFKGHKLDKHMELGIETEVVDEVEHVGLMEKLAAAIQTRYAPGLKIEKIRTKKRTVAGMKGEEIIIRATEKDGGKEISFMWEFPGILNDAHLPNVIIDMDAQDDQLEAKIALWDSILDSMRPAGR